MLLHNMSQWKYCAGNILVNTVVCNVQVFVKGVVILKHD